MEGAETSLIMGRTEMSLQSQSFVPNFIKNADDEDQSFDL